ncbi:Mitotic checkpoint serine/threonine-protein kinase BUB1 beta [Araneus ventricosus]|uniref:Mitotic checkpoint serine/threonine-protein kinase BUB1 beta n=1 Tax=Araneus ventricosus TaxID=182803 RepID=A0A4Y2H4I6_ARAVE|nr:Mitotic checkpoint serine/threonine-protein kinase BUB1 beta [Araneus ventricosus]
MAASSDEWELSKENIQPLQQGRKPEVLKVALSSNPEDLILQQRQAFENELRTYTGDDPLSIWCKYIKWVEQNYPKGGRDGHIEQLIQQCLSILKDKSEYYDDKRFIEIWLKFANMVSKPTEIYNYMYSHKIGCKSATFFAAWSWELESQGNISKADQVLNEGVRRKVEPFDKLKSYQSEFEMRVAAKVMANSEQIQNSEEPSRAAFAVLKPVKKKNVAPVVRVGDRVVDPGKVAMTIGRQQPLPKSNLPSGKVPFKIYSGENIQPSLPVQSENIAPFVLHSDNSKENEKKPSKWNKVKVKQMPSASRASQSAVPGFKLHCDESSPSQNTPRSVPKGSNILRVRKEPAAPPLALFEPADPMRKPMYDKEKVYGGAEEFSLEEIRAAEWFKKKKELEKERKLREQEKILREQQEQINRLTQELQLLKNKQSTSNELDNIPENKNLDKSCTKNFSADSQFSCFQNDKSDAESSRDSNIASIQKELFPNSKLTSTFREASCIVRDLYNDTIVHPLHDTLGVHSENVRTLNPPQSKTSVPQVQKCLVFHDPVTIAKSDASKENASTGQFEPFKLFQDPTEVISQLSENARLHKASALNNDFEDEKGDVENIPPKGYIQETNKRELSGILQPSKNVAFVSLEYQEQEESDEEGDIVYSENNNHPLQDETLIPPCNTEQFVAATFLASTPRTHVKTEQKIPVQDEDDNFSESVQPSGEGYNLPPMQSTLDNAACSRQASKTENKSSMKDHSTLRGYTGQLSVIMESSREIYKSSSSSGSSASVTRLSHLEQCFSQEKSNTRKHFSRTDAFREPRPIVQGTELSHCTNDRENTFGSLKEPKLLSQKAEFSAATKRENNLKELKSTSSTEGTFKKPVVKKSDGAHINRDEFNSENAGIKEIYCTDIDPFDADLNAKILQSLPTDYCPNLHTSEKVLHQLEMKEKIQVGDLICVVQNLVSKGAYGTVYEAEMERRPNQRSGTHPNSKVALKLCKKSNDWELYICNIIINRLSDLKKLPDVRNSVMEIVSAHRYSDTLVLATEFSHQGTLLDLVNFYKQQHLGVPEFISMYLTLEMLHIMSQIHECQIIHGDIKPDNILLRDISNPVDLDNLSQRTVLLKFIDFGRGIDLKVFKSGVCFKTVLKDGCIEMKEKKPWVFQIDWYGFCNCIHVLLFSEYMRVKKNSEGRWTIEKNIKRYQDQSLWSSLFDELLNIPACYQEPDVLKYTSLIESKLKANASTFKMNFQRFLTFFVRK